MSTEANEPRIDYDELELDDQLALLNGMPFTGVVTSRYPDGALESEGRYREGLPEGEQRRWYPDGQLERRWIAIRGKGSSEEWSWRPDGRPRSHRRNEGWRPVELEAWDEAGRPIDYASLDESATSLRRSNRTA